jgi:hypothetical protein
LASSGSSSSQIVVCGSVSRSTADLQRTRRQENHNHVIQPPTGPRRPAFPQLNHYLSRDFFKAK